jgi:hypothetical protein
MKRTVSAISVSLAALAYGTLAAGAEGLVKFEGGIGVQTGMTATAAPNPVRGVNSAGRPWAIQKLKVSVRNDGSISAKGEGLVLAATDAIGTRGTVLQVAATLFCDTAAFTSPAADLSRGGDFQIRGTLTGTGPVPVPCNNPALLIRIVAANVAGNWIAAGTLDDDGGED